VAEMHWTFISLNHFWHPPSDPKSHTYNFWGLKCWAAAFTTHTLKKKISKKNKQPSHRATLIETMDTGMMLSV